MALDFTALQTEFYARGFDYLNDGGAGVTRAKRFLNDSMHRVNDMEPWCFLQTSTTGVGPVTINDLGYGIESVVDVANLNPLMAVDRRLVTTEFADTTSTGYAAFYYVTGGSTVNAFPVSTATLTIRYFKVQTDLSAGGDVPLMPDRFRYAIVDLAVAAALRDKSNFAEAQAAEATGMLIVQRMRDWNLLMQGSGGVQVMTGSSVDG